MIADATTMTHMLALAGYDAVVDLRDCWVTSIACGVIAGVEHVRGPRPEQWPAAVRARVEKELAQWPGKNPGRTVRLVSFGAVDDICFALIHHAPIHPAPPAPNQ